MSSGLGDRVYKIAADLVSLLSAPTRLRIVCALMEGEMNVTELIDCVALSLPDISSPTCPITREPFTGVAYWPGAARRA